MKKPSRQVRKQASAPKAIPQGSNKSPGANSPIERAPTATAHGESEIPNEPNPKLIFSFDEELEVVIRHWRPQKRRAAAEKFQRWVNELMATADLMDGKSVVANKN